MRALKENFSIKASITVEGWTKKNENPVNQWKAWLFSPSSLLPPSVRPVQVRVKKTNLRRVE